MIEIVIYFRRILPEELILHILNNIYSDSLIELSDRCMSYTTVNSLAEIFEPFEHLQWIRRFEHTGPFPDPEFREYDRFIKSQIQDLMQAHSIAYTYLCSLNPNYNDIFSLTHHISWIKNQFSVLDLKVDTCARELNKYIDYCARNWTLTHDSYDIEDLYTLDWTDLTGTFNIDMLERDWRNTENNSSQFYSTIRNRSMSIFFLYGTIFTIYVFLATQYGPLPLP